MAPCSTRAPIITICNPTKTSTTNIAERESTIISTWSKTQKSSLRLRSRIKRKTFTVSWSKRSKMWMNNRRTTRNNRSMRGAGHFGLQMAPSLRQVSDGLSRPRTASKTLGLSHQRRLRRRWKFWPRWTSRCKSLMNHYQTTREWSYTLLSTKPDRARQRWWNLTPSMPIRIWRTCSRDHRAWRKEILRTRLHRNPGLRQ